MDVHQICAALVALMLLALALMLAAHSFGHGARCPRCQSADLDRAAGVCRCRRCHSIFRDRRRPG